MDGGRLVVTGASLCSTRSCPRFQPTRSPSSRYDASQCEPWRPTTNQRETRWGDSGNQSLKYKFTLSFFTCVLQENVLESGVPDCAAFSFFWVRLVGWGRLLTLL